MKFLAGLRGNIRKLILIGIDCLFFCFIDLAFYYLSSIGVLSHSPVSESIPLFLKNSAILLLAVLISRWLFGIYRNVWRYTSTKSYFNLILADALGAMAAQLTTQLVHSYRGLWHFIVVASLTAHASMMARLCYRLLYKRKNNQHCTNRPRRNAAIAGAGQLGTYLANDLRTNANSRFDPMFFVDTDPDKVGKFVVGLPVYHPSQVKTYIGKYGVTDVIIAISDADSDRITPLYHTYRDLGCNVMIFDTLVHENGEPSINSRHIREFSIEDMLFRKPLKINNQLVLDYYTGAVVMITGGGGSIGSELCRQIAKCNPGKLIILDNYENNAYDIQQELLSIYGSKLEIVVEIASVQDESRLDHVFRTHHPDVVFHAAAHKHVPLMESCGYEAVKNNVLGTYHVANMAEKHHVRKFIMISTDKAVNPTNVMGATKRLCEMIIQCRRNSQTCFAAVRFGNVLGSNGSVIPLFRRQIAAGGPVTITDKRIIRYFMTIHEASQLVIQAGAIAKRGELFVLDMGKPVKIYDLAVNMIKLSGLTPDVDIPIVEVGLRPGEKLYEELLIREEELDKTENELIFIERDQPLSREEVDEKVAYLRRMAEAWDAGDAPDARTVLKEIVPTFCDPEDLNQNAESSAEMSCIN